MGATAAAVGFSNARRPLRSRKYDLSRSQCTATKGKGEKDSSSAFYLAQQNRIRRRDLDSALLEE
jgi:hypothetical protein